MHSSCFMLGFFTVHQYGFFSTCKVARWSPVLKQVFVFLFLSSCFFHCHARQIDMFHGDLPFPCK